MVKENYIDDVFMSVVDHMTTDKWQWPDNWDTQRKLDFVDHSIKWAEEREYYEQCAILQNVRKTIIE
jgi:hypothetical protein